MTAGHALVTQCAMGGSGRPLLWLVTPMPTDYACAIWVFDDTSLATSAQALLSEMPSGQPVLPARIAQARCLSATQSRVVYLRRLDHLQQFFVHPDDDEALYAHFRELRLKLDQQVDSLTA